MDDEFSSAAGAIDVAVDAAAGRWLVVVDAEVVLVVVVVVGDLFVDEGVVTEGVGLK